MICRDIYGSSLSLLGEDTSGEYSEDYERRVSYLIPLLYALLSEKDDALREARGLGKHGNINIEKTNLDEEFMLCEDFLPAAAYYVSSMLIFDSDSARADKLYEKYSDTVEKIMKGIPFKSEKTVDKYPY